MTDHAQQQLDHAIRKTLRIRQEHVENSRRSLAADLAFLREIDAKLWWCGIYPDFEFAMQDANPECIGVRIEGAE